MTATPSRRGQTAKSSAAFRTISEVSQDLDVPQHVLRFWETKFNQIKPLKRGGGRRYYRPEDLALLRRIRDLLYTEGYTIRGVQRLLRQNGVKAVLSGQARESGDAGSAPAAAPGTSAVAAPGNADAEQSRPVKLDGATRRELEIILAELTDLRKLLP